MWQPDVLTKKIDEKGDIDTTVLIVVRYRV